MSLEMRFGETYIVTKGKSSGLRGTLRHTVNNSNLVVLEDLFAAGDLYVVRDDAIQHINKQESFWTIASFYNWRMSWKAWKILLKSMISVQIVDDDSEYLDHETVVVTDAQRAFEKCTCIQAK